MAKDDMVDKTKLDQALKDAEERTRREAVERAQVADLKHALEPLANIAPPERHYGDCYHINRARNQARLTGADLELAAKVFADPAATKADCRRALQPLIVLPLDVRLADPEAPLYSFPARTAGQVHVTTRAIEQARRLLAQ